MKRLAKLALSLALAAGPLWAQPAPNQQDSSATQPSPPAYHAPDQQPQSDDRERVQQRDNEQSSSATSAREPDPSPQQPRAQNPEDPTYNDQHRRDMQRQSQDRDRSRTHSDQDESGPLSRSERGAGTGSNPNRKYQYGTDPNPPERDRTYSYDAPASHRVEAFQMSAAERSGFRAGLSAGRSDRAHRRQFSPNVSAGQDYNGEDRELFRLGFREGYQDGYYSERATTAEPR